MKSKTKKVYETPQLTVVSFKTERGYASSVRDEFIFWNNNQSSEQMESYYTANDWNEGSNSFWD